MNGIRISLACVALAGALALSGCMPTALSSNRTIQQRMETTQYRMVDTQRAWLHVPQGLLTLERDLQGVREQRIALPNDTSLSGDNFVLLRTRGGGALRGARFDLERFVELSGGAPYPFRSLSNRNMRTGSDALGAFFWTEQAMGPGVTCVAAVRSLDRSARPLPGRAAAVDVMMRNCVRGDARAALAPIRAETLSATPAAGAGATAAAPTLRNRSPFAAPTGG
ncbi:hypothetical protein SAMN04488012_11039 [Palleronia salina]|uniref:Group 4 capsule polysaccharide lipoprotein gfcB, YjbF n=1 Tax=Palleronia salina TaxID=313368 RepID=A0A1M6JNC7_9RHOB|nr:hypothetical protein [Palleronia salina]SHJ48138.1 hypothetical protein SAMN04488012_11039 [Palleronia salina]